VSEDDLDNLRLENQALEAELEQERRQAELLNRALTSVYKERDRLVDLLNAPPAPEEEAAAPEEAGSPQPVAGQARVYVVRSGDTLGAIAQRHGTTTAVLVSLNPFLGNRSNYMVWENDRINLPR
jgi:LysM repeat protein